MASQHPVSRTFLSAVAIGCAALPALAQGNPFHSCTYLGGTGGQEAVQAVVVAGNGDLVVAGQTDSANFPVTAGAFDGQYNGLWDAFVARLSPDGSQVLAATYLGGNGIDDAWFVHVGADGSIWVGGTTEAADFPTTPDAFSTHRGRADAFVANFSPDLTTLRYGTTLGDTSHDTGEGFAIDDQNQLIYVGGRVTRGSPSALMTPNAVQPTHAGNGDLYLAVLDRSNSGTTTLAYGTQLGGIGQERDFGDLTLEGNGVVTITGVTSSTDFPITGGAVQSTGGGTTNGGVVARIDTQANGAAGLLYGSYLGGSGHEIGIRHATDSSGVVHVMLESTSQDLPVTSNALISTPGTNGDVYYAQIDPAQTGAAGLRYGSWILTTGGEQAVAIALAGGKVAMTLETTGFGQPTTAGAFMSYARGHGGGFVIELDLRSGPNPSFSYASHYVGCRQTHPQAMAYDGNEVVVVGHCERAPVTPGAAQFQPASSKDGFVGRLELRAWPSPFASFGTACAGSAGTPQMVGVSAARICETLVLRATGLPPSGVGILFAGFDRTQYQGAPLPFSLAALGAPGCEVSVAPQVILFRIANLSGNVDLSVPIPENPRLLGTVLFSQFALVDLPANPLGLVTTNGLSAEVRW